MGILTDIEQPVPGRVLKGTDLGRLEKHVSHVYARGGLSLNDAQPAVAIVGSRDCTDAGIDAARMIARQMVAAGYAIISGAARGIDRAAHEAALSAGGKTVAVLAHINDEDGKWIRDCFDTAPDRAISVSAIGREVRHSRNLYAARNKHIAALSDEVVVVEGKVGSGTLHTAMAAWRMKIPIWAVGGITAWSYTPCVLVEEGRARLLRPWQAARQICGPPVPPLFPGGRGHGRRADGGDLASGDLFDADGGDAGDVDSAEGSVPPESSSPLVLAIRAAGGRLTVDDAIRALGTTAREVLAEAGALELDGLLRREGPFLVA